MLAHSTHVCPVVLVRGFPKNTALLILILGVFSLVYLRGSTVLYWWYFTLFSSMCASMNSNAHMNAKLRGLFLSFVFRIQCKDKNKFREILLRIENYISLFFDKLNFDNFIDIMISMSIFR